MPTSPYFKFTPFPGQLVTAIHNFGANQFKLMFSNTLPDPGLPHTGFVTEITAGNGYPAGGLTVPTSTQIGGDGAAPPNGVKATDVTLSATGPIGPFRYLCLYNASTVGYLVCWWDYGSALTLANGDTFTVDFQDNVLFTIT